MSHPAQLVVFRHYGSGRPAVAFQSNYVDGFTFGEPQIFRVQQVLDRCSVITTAEQSRFDSLLQLMLTGVPMLALFSFFDGAPSNFNMPVATAVADASPKAPKSSYSGILLLLAILQLDCNRVDCTASSLEEIRSDPVAHCCASKQSSPYARKVRFLRVHALVPQLWFRQYEQLRCKFANSASASWDESHSDRNSRTRMNYIGGSSLQ